MSRSNETITKTIPPLLQVPRRQRRGMGLIISQSSYSIHLTKCLARNGILPVYTYNENLGPPLLTRTIDFKSMTRDRLQRHISSLSPVEWKWTETNLHEQSVAPCLHPQSPTFWIETTNKRATSWALERVQVSRQEILSTLNTDPIEHELRWRQATKKTKITLWTEVGSFECYIYI